MARGLTRRGGVQLQLGSGMHNAPARIGGIAEHGIGADRRLELTHAGGC
jgi:hypothetical protein